MKAPLSGIRVLDFGHIVAGPFCARMLADLGADVVKVETQSRDGQLGARKGKGGGRQNLPRHGRTALLAHVNRNRRSIDLNLKTDEGIERALKLIGAADVLVENFSSGVMERLGLGYETLQKVNPRLVYASMSGYGHSGPRRDWISMNVNLQAHCGLMLVTGAPGDPPIGISNSWNDYIAGLHAALAVVGALAERVKTGQGRHLDVSQFDACVATVGGLVWSSAVTKKAPPREGNRSTEFAPQGCYPCAGKDQWCALSVRDDAQWKALAGLVGVRDDRLATLQGRFSHHDQIDAAISAWTRNRSKEDAEAALKAVGVPAERVRRANELFGTPEWEQLLHTVEDSPGENTRVVGLPFKFGTSENTKAYPAPRLGEHTNEVLRDWLGLKEAV
jgi:benzylsuccinate CoA-transferase BbsF subunit